MPEKRTTTPKHRSPIFCCNWTFQTIFSPLFRTAFVSAIAVSFLVSLILALCGATNAGRSAKSLYIASLFFLLVALVLLNVFYWLWKRRDHVTDTGTNNRSLSVATVGSSEYYNQVPPGKKTDFPMGPHLVLTLPRTLRDKNNQAMCPNDHANKSVPSTPGSGRLKNPRRNKNVPPLASEETLSPSLQSSYLSIDSVV